VSTTLEPTAPPRHPEPPYHPEPPRHPGRHRAPRRGSPDLLVASGVVLLILVVHGWNITAYPGLGDDEGTYLSQAWAVQQGVGLAPYTYWYDHPPLGWLQLALLSWLPTALWPGDLVVGAGRLAMLPVTAVSAALVYVLARRLSLRWPTAIAATLVFGLSPLSVTMLRQIYLDSFAVAWMLGAFVLALSPRRSLWQHTAAGVCAACSILSKETMAVVLPAVLLALWQGSHPSTRKFSFVGFASGLLLIGGFYPLYAVLKSELLPGEGHVSLIGAMLFQLHDRTGSGSMLTPGSGAHELLQSWLFYDAVLPIGGALAAVLGLASRRLRAPALAGVLLVLVAARPGGYLPAMFVIQALPFFAIALAGVAETALLVVLPRLIRPVPWSRTVAVTVGLLLVVVVVGPRWYVGEQRVFTTSANDHSVEVVRWVREHVPDRPGTRIVVDNTVWLDMERLGFSPGLGVIWHYKLDRDPAVSGALPAGWRDVDYIVSSPIIRRDARDLPTVEALLAHSRPLAAFGAGSDRVEVRRIAEGAS